VPPHPADASVDSNIFEAQVHTADPNWYAKHIVDNGPWDYKTQGYDDFGNFNFGATAAGLGIPDSIIVRGAGWYKWYKLRKQGVPDPWGRPWDRKGSVGNQPDKNANIQAGIDYYRRGCVKQPPNGPIWGQPQKTWDGDLP
jgi:hypothetical protein